MIRKLANFNLQFNISILNGLKIKYDVLILSLEEEFSFNECDQATIQKFLPHLTSYLVFDKVHYRKDPVSTSSCNSEK